MTATPNRNDRARLVARMIEHGATQVAMADLVDQAQILWHIGSDDPVSETCIHAEETMASGARSCRRALNVLARIQRTRGAQDADLATALKKYVQDTCEAIKQVDNALRKKGSDLATLLFEIPDRSQGEMSWRNLIGRRDVIAHQLLTVDDQRVQREAQRDFNSLHQLLSRVHFALVKSNLEAGRTFLPMFRGDAVQRLSPGESGSKPTTGQGLIFVFEDEKRGFLAFRLGRSANNEILIAGPPGTDHISITHLRRVAP